MFYLLDMVTPAIISPRQIRQDEDDRDPDKRLQEKIDNKRKKCAHDYFLVSSILLLLATGVIGENRGENIYKGLWSIAHSPWPLLLATDYPVIGFAIVSQRVRRLLLRLF